MWGLVKIFSWTDSCFVNHSYSYSFIRKRINAACRVLAEFLLCLNVVKGAWIKHLCAHKKLLYNDMIGVQSHPVHTEKAATPVTSTADMTRCLLLVSTGDINSDPFPMRCHAVRSKEVYECSLVLRISAAFVSVEHEEMRQHNWISVTNILIAHCTSLVSLKSLIIIIICYIWIRRYLWLYNLKDKELKARIWN